jgi:hypothetical protein
MVDSELSLTVKSKLGPIVGRVDCEVFSGHRIDFVTTVSREGISNGTDNVRDHIPNKVQRRTLQIQGRRRETHQNPPFAGAETAAARVQFVTRTHKGC